MKKMLISAALIIIVATITIVAANNITRNSMVTDSLSNCVSLKISGQKLFFNNEQQKNELRDFVYLETEDKDEISLYYYPLVRSTAWTYNEKEHTDLKAEKEISYILEFTYKDGNKDVILKPVDSVLYYKETSENGEWMGGLSSDLDQALQDLYYSSRGVKRK